MALVNCPECEKQISDKASACIHCGCPLDDVQLKKVVLFDWGQKSHKEICDYLRESINMTNDKHTEIILALIRDKQFILIDNIDVKQASIINNKLISLGAISSIYDANDENIEIPYIEEIGVPRCLTCGSEHITNLTVVDRMISTALVGIASGKIGKQFECKNCGYRW